VLCGLPSGATALHPTEDAYFMADDIDNEDLEGLDVSAEAGAEDEDIDDGDFDGGDEFDGDDDVEFGGDDDDADDDDDDDEDDDEESSTESRRRAANDGDDDDEEMVNPDDVEADLDTILKDRMVTVTVDDDDEEETPVVEERGEVAEGVKPKRADEQMCPSCFLLVRSNAPACPVGDDDCPILSA